MTCFSNVLAMASSLSLNAPASSKRSSSAARHMAASSRFLTSSARPARKWAASLTQRW